MKNVRSVLVSYCVVVLAIAISAAELGACSPSQSTQAKNAGDAVGLCVAKCSEQCAASAIATALSTPAAPSSSAPLSAGSSSAK